MRTDEADAQLLAAIKAHLPELKDLWDRTTEAYADYVYRFYHHSFKVFGLQNQTEKIVEKLTELHPADTGINQQFLRIYKHGTGRRFTPGTNSYWNFNTGPVLEAFFHARYFLEMAINFGEKLPYAPRILPAGWAGILYFYNLR